MKRRTFMTCLAGTTALGILSRPAWTATEAPRPRPDKIIRSDSEWRQRLSSERYLILRQEDTERAFSSALNHETRTGTFTCAACALSLFDSTMKFDSGTGWPSFFEVLPAAIETRIDFRLILPRTEYHCARCGGHQGHIFKDGPEPTGLRYCNNGLALIFKPTSETPS